MRETLEPGVGRPPHPPPAVDEVAPGLEIDGVSKAFGDVQALRGVTLGVGTGEFFTLLGPSGCGKTTLLRIIGGFETPDAGRVALPGLVLTGLPANRRPVNTVFQSYALFPHLTVRENVAFGLRSRKLPPAEVDARLAETMAMLKIEGLAARRPHQISGGQKQRVALARALVNRPRLLLLDEPMSALDAKLRAEVQVELRRLQRRLGTTFVLVTHDQDEAMAVSDRIAVMRDGEVVQAGAPDQVYERPRSRFVAEFLGAANLIPAERHPEGASTPFGVLRLPAPLGQPRATLAIRPERVALAAASPDGNAVRARVRDVVYRGDHVEVFMDEPAPLRARAPAGTPVPRGEAVALVLPPDFLVALDD